MQCWNDEIIKATLYFDNGKTYDCSNNSDYSDNLIVTSSKRQVEQVNYNNLFGGICSNEFSLTLYDDSNILNISNNSIPYYTYMRVGVKIIAKISYDNGVTFDDYGTFYVTEWGNSYFDGMINTVTINSCDRLQYIMNSDMPKLKAYSGVAISVLLTDTLTKLGIDKNKIKIDKSLDYNLIYGTSEDEKVGYFLNEVCQAMCAVMIIDDSDNILIVPALSGYGTKYNLDTNYIVDKKSSNNVNNIYSKVKLKYYKNVGQGFGDILTSNEILKHGVNEFHNLLFSNKALSISEIKIESDNDNALTSVEVTDFAGYQNGIDIIVYNGSKDDINVTINVIGDYIKTNENYVYSDIEYTDNKQSVSYDVTNQYVQTSYDAQLVADKLAKYIELMDTKITLDTIYTPKINCGDVLVFNDVEMNLVGKYKVISCYTLHSSNYNNEITLIPLRDTIWDDKLSWDDSKSWLENFGLSQS